ncbi:hypothetical protein M5K25_017064 [Dendrobium thyrsiflorum]|uniref:Uncharacterized protein n=1 Tax=Dendrobium thyrsiflorum TaxID=117978 RepID=A0ABD0ULB7_DENTH
MSEPCSMTLTCVEEVESNPPRIDFALIGRGQMPRGRITSLTLRVVSRRSRSGSRLASPLSACRRPARVATVLLEVDDAVVEASGGVKSRRMPLSSCPRATTATAVVPPEMPKTAAVPLAPLRVGSGSG